MLLVGQNYIIQAPKLFLLRKSVTHTTYAMEIIVLQLRFFVEIKLFLQKLQT